VFTSERGGPFTTDATNLLVKGIRKRASLPFFRPRPHAGHACGYALANAGQDTRRIQSWLGHRSIQHTVRYTELSAAPFKEFWHSQ
jgi:site-specific recombinase XerD